MKTNARPCFALALALASFSLPLQVLAADPYALAPGTLIPAASSTFPMGGTVLASVTSPFTAGNLSGTLVTDVIQGDTANPFNAGGGLTFTYSLSISASSVDSSSEMTVSPFAGFHTEVSYNLSGTEIAPASFSRNSPGDTVRFTWLPSTIGPGQEGALVVVQTDAIHFAPTTAGIIDGVTFNAASLAPLPVPEPATAGLLLVGVGTLLALRRRFS